MSTGYINPSTTKRGVNTKIKKCALYLMRDNRSGDVKIGISNNPLRRLKEVEKQYNVGSVSLINKTWFLKKEDANKYEKIFHKRYLTSISLSRGGREWFTLSDKDINGFLDTLILVKLLKFFCKLKSFSVPSATVKLESDLILLCLIKSFEYCSTALLTNNSISLNFSGLFNLSKLNLSIIDSSIWISFFIQPPQYYYLKSNETNSNIYTYIQIAQIKSLL